MDPRVREHAEILVDHCTDVRRGDMVQVSGPAAAEDLVVAVYEALGERGARPTLGWVNQRAGRAYARAMDPDDYVTAEHRLARIEETDAAIYVAGTENAAELSDVPGEATGAARRASEPIADARPDRWVLTRHPTPAAAQQAGMSTEAYADFVYDAVNRDWDAQREFQAQLVELLDPADEVRVVAGEDTDVRMSVAGMDAVNDCGETNMPGGEVFTAPVPESVEGTVRFDVPVTVYGNEVRDAFVRFEDGEVVEYAAARNEAALGDVLDTDEGARRVGELGVGMNRGIDRFTGTVLFDEKMGDTVHLAFGSAIDECVPESREANDSATHRDMLVDVSADSRIEVDGEVVQRDGTFVFEDGFDA